MVWLSVLARHWVGAGGLINRQNIWGKISRWLSGWRVLCGEIPEGRHAPAHGRPLQADPPKCPEKPRELDVNKIHWHSLASLAYIGTYRDPSVAGPPVGFQSASGLQ